MTTAAAIEKHIAFCGLDCSGCEVYIATKTDDDELRREYAAKQYERWKITIEPETVNCHGCRSLTPKTGFCARCEVRRCTMERKLENCAYCVDYPCEKLDRVHAAMINIGKAIGGVATARLNLDTIRKEKNLS
jgi:hypothetical protein